MVHKYSVAGPGHDFNDLAITAAGDVYLTDTRAGAVWHLGKGADLIRLSERFAFANGIALSPNDSLLYVSTFPDGIMVLHLKTNITSPIARPADLCLAMIDGLYFRRGALTAIQWVHDAASCPLCADSRFSCDQTIRGSRTPQSFVRWGNHWSPRGQRFRLHGQHLG